MVSKARLDLPEPDSPVITISALRGILRCRSLRLCSRAPETTISPCDLTASSLRGRLAGAATGPATSGRRLPAGAGVDLFEDRLGVVEVEVLVQVARGLLARSPVERHVERDQPRPLDALPLSPRRLIAADAFEVDRRLPAGSHGRLVVRPRLDRLGGGGRRLELPGPRLLGRRLMGRLGGGLLLLRHH